MRPIIRVATPHPDRTNVLDQQQMAAMRRLTEPAAEPIEHAQNPIILHKSVIDIFPELDLTDIIRQYGNQTSSEILAAWIVDNMDKIPKRLTAEQISQGQAFGNPQSHNETINNTTLNFTFTEEGSKYQQSELLVDKMLDNLLHKIKVEMESPITGTDKPRDGKAIKDFLCDQFISVKVDFAKTMIRIFNLAIVPSAIACFFAENGFGHRLQQLILSLSQTFWCKSATPLCLPRKRKFCCPDEQFQPEFQRYLEILANYRNGEYAALITSDFKLNEQYEQIKYEREHEKPMECMVCFEAFTVNRMFFCNAPTVQLLTATNQEVDYDKPGPSRLFFQDADQGGADTVHAFCRDCVRGQALAASDTQPLADGGVGLHCMAPDCKNPILYSEIRMILNRDIRRKLDERIFEENIGLASLQNLERCKDCNFAIEMEIDKTVDKVFDCPNCHSKFCRNCHHAWNDEHFGISCEELDTKLTKDQQDKKARELEKELNEAVIRRCPRCGIAFMKNDGCNKMTCRCGMTQCYLCRESNIAYNHFCEHVRDPTQPGRKCNMCTKPCLLWEDANKRDELVVNEIREKGAPIMEAMLN